MEIFKHGVIFKNFEEIYAGRLANFLTNEQFIIFCQKKKIQNCNEDILINLIVNEKESKHSFLNSMSNLLDINHLKGFNEMTISGKKFENVSFDIWKLEYLLRTRREKNKERVLEKIYEYFYMFQFPDEWNKGRFILYSHYPDNGEPILNEDLYLNFIEYVNKEIKRLKKSHTS